MIDLIVFYAVSAIHNFFPRLRHSCWAQTLLVTWRIRQCNRETVSVMTCTQVEAVNRVRFLTVQIIERNCFLWKQSVCWEHGDIPHKDYPCVVLFSLHKRGETEMAAGITSRQFAKECVSTLNTFYLGRPTARNPTIQSEVRFVFKLHRTTRGY